jgi:hypothetical protein
LEPSLVEGIRMIANKFPDVDLGKVSEEEYGKYYEQVPENSGWEWFVCRKCQRKLKTFSLEKGSASGPHELVFEVWGEAMVIQS